MTNSTEKKFVFVLGGNDLEMQEIQKVLVTQNQKFISKTLGWGEAKLSAYKEEIEALEQDVTIIPVELVLDFTPIQEVIEIDHHNENSSKPASILQVLELLGLEPTREQILVGVNDVGHIRAMQAFGATSEEIASVRLADRQAQGITQEQEKMGIEALQNAKKVGNVLVIESKTSKFAPSMDRLEGKEKNVIIFAHEDRYSEIDYYGIGKDAVIEEMSKIYAPSYPESFSGGDEFGYWGRGNSLPNHKENIDWIKNYLINFLNK